MSRRLDGLALTAAVLALAMLLGYLEIMRRESDVPAPWFVAALILGSALAGYGANVGAHHRGSALLLAGLLLAVVGVLAVPTIGLPILVAGVLCLVAAARSSQRRSAAPRPADDLQRGPAPEVWCGRQRPGTALTVAVPPPAARRGPC